MRDEVHLSGSFKDVSFSIIFSNASFVALDCYLKKKD
jgi:hypothetical protein